MKDASNVLMGHEAKGKDEIQQPLHQSQILPGSIKNRHLEHDVVVRGLSADLPDGSTRTKCFFSTDTGVLSIWTGDEWLSTTLS